MKKYFSLFILAATFLSACYYDNFSELNPLIDNGCDTASTNTISFATQIKPILEQQCSTGSTSCHSANSGRDMTTVTAIVNNYGSNTFLGSVTWDGSASTMPKNSPTQIDNCSIAFIRLWINQGMNNN
ncbi:MAG: hypothetical protein RI952_386 [Bacteroidota bacterium]|jgi:hypothetical protein